MNVEDINEFKKVLSEKQTPDGFIKVTDNKKVFADGLHDDTKALQEYIDSVKEGGTVYFPRMQDVSTSLLVIQTGLLVLVITT